MMNERKKQLKEVWSIFIAMIFIVLLCYGGVMFVRSLYHEYLCIRYGYNQVVILTGTHNEAIPYCFGKGSEPALELLENLRGE